MRLTHPSVIVRTYQDKSPDQTAKRFKVDAEGLAQHGYSVSRVTTNPADSVLHW